MRLESTVSLMGKCAIETGMTVSNGDCNFDAGWHLGDQSLVFPDPLYFICMCLQIDERAIGKTNSQRNPLKALN
jgi:hypothetical protein